MRLRSGYEVRRARLEMVPLFDTVFLLLAFFIYAMATETVCRGVTVALPSASGVAEPVDNLVITLTPDNRLLLQEEPVSLAQAVEATVARYRRSPCKVLIQGDRSANLGTAIDLLSRLRGAGIQAVSFLVKEERP